MYKAHGDYVNQKCQYFQRQEKYVLQNIESFHLRR